MDTAARCFVCTLERSVFEMYGNGFDAHTKEEHNPMAYMFYWCLVCLSVSVCVWELA